MQEDGLMVFAKKSAKRYLPMLARTFMTFTLACEHGD